MTTTTIPVIAADDQAAPLPVSALDRLAMRIGLALLLWGRHHADTRRAPVPERPTLAADARWYMR